MQFIGWIQYNHDSQPPHYIRRNRYYKLHKLNDDYVIEHENGNETLDLDIIKKIFKPANGYNSWDEIIPQKNTKVDKKEDNKVQDIQKQSIISTNINTSKELKSKDKVRE